MGRARHSPIQLWAARARDGRQFLDFPKQYRPRIITELIGVCGNDERVDSALQSGLGLFGAYGEYSRRFTRNQISNKRGVTKTTERYTRV